jgi:hypothetical protein
MGEPELLPELRVCVGKSGRASVAEAGAALQRLPLHALGLDLASAVARRAAAMQADEDRAEVRARLAALLPPGLALATVRYELDADGGVLGGCASAARADSADGVDGAYVPVTPELLREAARIAQQPFGHASIELAVDGLGVARLAVYHRNAVTRITRVEYGLRCAPYADRLARFRVASDRRVECTRGTWGQVVHPRPHDDAATLPLPWMQPTQSSSRLDSQLALAYPVYEALRGARLDIEIDGMELWCPSRDAAHRTFFGLDRHANHSAADPTISKDFLDVVRATVAGLGDRLTARIVYTRAKAK